MRHTEHSIIVHSPVSADDRLLTDSGLERTLEVLRKVDALETVLPVVDLHPRVEHRSVRRMALKDLPSSCGTHHRESPDGHV